MAFVTLSAAVDMGNPATSRPGGEYNGAQYLIAGDWWNATEANAMGNIHALKSTDGGATWTEMDAANFPVLTTSADGPAPMYTVAQNGSKFYVLHARTESNVISGEFSFLGWELVVFDAATDTWGSLTTPSGPTTVWRPTSGYRVYLELLVRDTDDMIVLFSSEHAGGGDSGNPVWSYCTFDGSNLGSAVAIPGSDSFGLAAAVDASKRTTIWYETLTDNKLNAITLSPSNVFGTRVVIGNYGSAGSSAWGDWSNGLSYTRNGANHVAVAYSNYSAGKLYVYLLDAEAADQPTFASSTVGERVGDIPGAVIYNAPRYLSIAENNGTLAVIWGNSEAYYTPPCNFLYATSSSTGDFAWSEAAELMKVTNSEDDKMQASQAFAFAMTGGIGVFGQYESGVVTDPLVADVAQFARISTSTPETETAEVTCTIVVENPWSSLPADTRLRMVN